jgi:peroxiredoxin
MLSNMKVKLFVAALMIAGVVAIANSNLSASNTATVEVGKAVENFTVKNADGKDVKLTDFKDKIVVMEWVNPGCPFVVGHYKNGNMQSLQKKYAEKGIAWVLVSSTNSTHKDFLSGADLKKQFAEWKGAQTDILVDADGKIGKMFDAKTTPHMYIINKDGKLAYAGAIDDDRSTNGGKDSKVNYVSKALDELLAGKEVSEKTTKQYGCGVKY